MFKSRSSQLAIFALLTIATALFVFGFVSSSASSANDQVVNSLGETDIVRFISMPANDIVFNPADNKLYVSVPSSAGSIGNSITPIDPYTGNIGTSVWMGSEPSKLALAGDGQTLYTYLAGAYSVGRFNMATQASTGAFMVGTDPFYGLFTASDIAVSPDDPNIVAVARQAPNVSPSQRGVAIYSNGTRLPQTGPDHIAGSDYLAFSESGATLYGSGSYSGIKRYTVTGTGATAGAASTFGGGGPIKFASGPIFSNAGQVVDAATLTLLGTFPNAGGGSFVPDPAVGRAYYLTPAGSPANAWTLKAYDINTFTLIGSLTIPNVSGGPTALVRWGTNGLAFRTNGGQIVLVHTSLIPTQNPIPAPSATPTITPTPTPTPWIAAIRQVPVNNNDLVYSSARQKFYASVPSSAGMPRGNTLTEIDPVTGELGTSTFVGSEPTQMSITDDQSAIFIGVNGSGGFRRFDLTNNTVGPVISLGTSDGPVVAVDLEAHPGSSNTVAIGRIGNELRIYDGSVRRPQTASGGPYIRFESADVLFGSDGTLRKYSVTSNGLSQVASINASAAGKPCVANGKVYSGNGRVFHNTLASMVGTYFGLGYDNVCAVDVEHQRAFFVTNESGSYTIRAYELNTFRPIGSIAIPSLSQIPRELLRWGTNGLAFRTDNRVFLVQSDLVDGGDPVPPPSPTPTITPTPSPTPAATFVRRLDLPVNDLVYNAGTGSVIATVPGVAGAGVGNTMTHLDPATGQIIASTFIGSEPGRIATSDDGQTLYTRLNGANAIRRYNLVTRTAGIQFPLPSSFSQPTDMAVMPGSPDTIVLGSTGSGVGVLDNGVLRGSPNGPAYRAGSLAFSSNPNILYAYNNETTGFDLTRFTIGPTGATPTPIASSLIAGFGVQIKFLDGLLYATSGRVVDPESVSLLTTLQNGGSTMAIDVPNNRVFFMSGNVLSAYDLTTYVKIGSATIGGFSGVATSLARWGTNGLVFRAQTQSGSPEGNVYLIQSALVTTSAPIPTGLSFNTQLVSGFEGSTNMSIQITRTGDTSTTNSVDYATADGTAIAGQDYTARSGNVVFAAGETTKTITIPIINDNIYEGGTENFTLNLSNATGANTFIVSPASATLTISDNDSRPGVSNLNGTVREPVLGQQGAASVTVRLSNPSVENISVSFATASGTATAGADYQSTNVLVSFAPLETTKQVLVPILPDTLFEPNETFAVNLSGATNATITTGTATITINNLNHAAHVFDFDGDAKTDVGVFRPAAGEWWMTRSSDGSSFATPFGAETDRIAPADYTGDGKTDVAFWRPSTGEWFVLRSEDLTYYSLPFGANGDIHAPADYDADGKADTAVFRPSTATWYIRRASDGGVIIQPFGSAGDVPVPADYDGDGRADVAIFRPSNGEWWIDRSTAGVIATTFGSSGDKPVAGDYTGDGKADVAFWRPSTGEWFVLRSNDFSFFSFPFGASGDVPASGDYDGDGKLDATVFRPSTATWYSLRSAGGTVIQQFGADGDKPIPNAFIP